MSKIICDVCGTSYPETATQCPICGCVRPVDVGVVTGASNESESQTAGGYTYVKGGRFSKSNVKKRSRAPQPAGGDPAAKNINGEREINKNDKGLIISVIVLLLAIVAVVIYIAMRFFAPGLPAGGNDQTLDAPTETSSQVATETTEATIPCVELTVSKSLIQFEKVNAALLLNVSTDPVDTTDEVNFASTDTNVATVTKDGKVTAVGPGEAVITITCGQAAAECKVICNFEATEPTDETTEPTEETTAATTDAEETDSNPLRLNWRYAYPENPEIGDVTLKKGETWVAYLDGEGKVYSTNITFTSSNASVVTINSEGVVTAVGVGEAMITASYQGQQAKCRVLVR